MPGGPAAGHRGETIFGAGTPEEQHIAPHGAEMFIASYHLDGSFQWAASAGGDDVLLGDIAIAPDGAILATGRFIGLNTFGRGERYEQTLSSDEYELWVARYSPDGELGWATSASTEGADTSTGRALAALPDGTVVVVGEFEGSVVFGTGQPDPIRFDGVLDGGNAFLLRLDASGQASCAIHLQTDEDSPQSLYMSAISPRSDGQIDVAGSLLGTLQLGEALTLRSEELHTFVLRLSLP